MRIMIKASGQTLAGNREVGLDPDAVMAFAREVVDAAEHAEVAIVVGGGNILRGSDSESFGIDRGPGSIHLGPRSPHANSSIRQFPAARHERHPHRLAYRNPREQQSGLTRFTGIA